MPLQYEIENYYKPKDLQQAVDMLSKFGNSAKIIAGGTDILPGRQNGVELKPIAHLIDISNLGLNYIRKGEDGICIGAATDINSLASLSLFCSNPYTALKEAASAHSTYTIRNRATIGENLCNASPCADLALPLLALSALLVVAGANGKRTIQLNSFFKGPNCTALLEDELLEKDGLGFE
ncbi:FAD binding domain-containing protein [Desulfocicer niacini]